eukprot:scaffold98542_cov24-Prasinocladus_malaysianus.AAC.1
MHSRTTCGNTTRNYQLQCMIISGRKSGGRNLKNVPRCPVLQAPPGDRDAQRWRNLKYFNN